MAIHISALIISISFFVWSSAIAAPIIPTRPQPGRLKTPASLQQEGQLRRAVDSLIGFSISLRPKEQALKSVAGIKGYSTPPTPSSTAFRCGSQLVILQIAEQTAKPALANATEALILKELTNLAPGQPPSATPTGSTALRQLVELNVEQQQVRVHYELGVWVEALRIPLRQTLRQPAQTISESVQTALTTDNPALYFQHQLPSSPIQASLAQIASYQKAPNLTTKDLLQILEQLDKISDHYR